MKNIFLTIASAVCIAVVLSSCHKTDVTVDTQLTPEVFPQTPAQYQAVTGSVYVALRSDYTGAYFFSQSHTTDENLLGIFGPDWIDGNRYMELHRHTWTRDNSGVSAIWYYYTNMIGVTNQTLSIFKNAPESAAKTNSIAELRTLRAFAYYIGMDNFGGVPLDTVYGNKELQPRATRTQVFNFIESELKASIPNLKSDVTAATYGLVTKYFAYSLLAKLYLNADVYTGTQRYNDCIAACDEIISSNKYSVEPMASYLQMFYPTNGPTTQKEFIYAIPYDASTSSGNLIFARYNLNRNLGIRYGYSGSTAGGYTNPVINQSTGNGLANNRPSGPSMTTAEYYAYFNDPNDIRNKQWLTGQQYWQDGSPIMVSTTNVGYNQFYNGPNPNDKIVYPLVLSQLTFRPRAGTNSDYDLGRDEIAWNTGYRNNKFIADYTNTINRAQGNDFPVFRYSDILLMKAEAILRGGAATSGATPVSLVNQIRANRTTSEPLTSINLDGVYAERVRELAYEGWHRNDMIRFGKYEGTWGLGKTNADTYRRIFPIPTSGFQTNTKLTQNPGY
ncbi:RagB/SusD family nutrient uptake outer membrane protein [Mucilaginibacter roseus]|uniref:RagB/SusD family nutrient uptake outer membrane protein n=1 Tax=Mucilaginibacter roseus TaxID=1528868 RepID=A0ABS8TYI0_9SPHI|nr:RagB/SusD family nutrient uptake outer membrane protein [Mucilaginibacter roseus]MCD8739930.1 RagB/SusD family nutrient uptake outer membrane protein [Mucilaginibacter roseus]